MFIGMADKWFEEYCILLCDAVWSGKTLPSFHNDLLHLHPKMKAAGFSKRSAYSNNTLHNIAEDSSDCR